MTTCFIHGVCQNPLGQCAHKCALARKPGRKPSTQMREIPLRDAEGLSLQARMVWLHIRDEGGWWSAKELARDLFPGEVHGPSIVAPCLHALFEREHVARRTAKPPVYGVTAKCRPPVGASLEPGQ